MSTETVLTLGVAAVILIAAAILRLFVIGLVRIAMGLAGKRVERWPQAVPAFAGPTWGERAHKVIEGIGLVALFIVAVLASALAAIGRQLAYAGRLTLAGMTRVAEWVWPRIESGSRSVARSSSATYRWARPRSVAAAQRAAGYSQTSIRRTQDWWHRRMVPALGRLAVEEAGAEWPLRFQDNGDNGASNGQARVIRLDELELPPAREIRLDDDVPAAREEERV